MRLLTIEKQSVATISLLQGAGFLFVWLSAYFGLPSLVVGALIYGAGVGLSWPLKDQTRIRRVGSMNVVLGLVNFTFYSTTEITPLVDVSLLLYGLLLLQLSLLVVRLKLLQPDFSLSLPYAGVAALYLGSIAASLVNAQHAKDTLYFFGFNLLAIVLFYVVINLFRDDPPRRVVRALVGTIVILGILSASAAVWQLYLPSFKIWYYPMVAVRDQGILELWEEVSRMVGTWQHPSYLGMFLAMTLPLTVYLMLYRTNRKLTRLLLGSCIIFISATLLLTNTRSSVISGILGIVLLYIYSHLPHWQFIRHIPSTKKIAALGLLAAGALLVYQYIFVEEIYRKPQAARADASATIWGRFLRSDSMSVESLVQRSDLYGLAWRLFRQHPLAGIGARNFAYEVEKEFKKPGTDTHNIILQTLAEQGSVGLTALVVFYGSVIFGLFKKLGDLAAQPDRRYLQATLLASVSLILFDSFFNNPLYSLRLTGVFWLLVAMLHVNYLSLTPARPAGRLSSQGEGKITCHGYQ